MLEFFRNHRWLTFGLPYAVLVSHCGGILIVKPGSPEHEGTATPLTNGYVLLAMFVPPLLALVVGVSDFLVKTPGPGGELERRARPATVVGLFLTLAFILLLLFYLYMLIWAIDDIPWTDHAVPPTLGTLS